MHIDWDKKLVLIEEGDLGKSFPLSSFSRRKGRVRRFKTLPTSHKSLTVSLNEQDGIIYRETPFLPKFAKFDAKKEVYCK